MAAITLEYNAHNSTVRQLIDGLLSSGLFKVQSEYEKERVEIRKNMRTAGKMIADIEANSSGKYQNMDSFLSSLK
jgi:roadblock/LC7 domain-containing protein